MTSVRAPQRSDRARPERRRPELRVVEADRAAAPRRNPLSLLGTLTVVLLFVALFGVIVFQVFLVQAQFRLDDLHAGVAAEEGLAKDLRLEIAVLEAPERIVRDARDRMGMIPPSDVVYLQPRAEDDARAAFDPATAPTTAVAATPPTTAWTAPATTVPKVTTTTRPATTTTTRPATTTTTRPATTTTTRPATTTTRPVTTTKAATAR